MTHQLAVVQRLQTKQTKEPLQGLHFLYSTSDIYIIQWRMQITKEVHIFHVHDEPLYISLLQIHIIVYKYNNNIIKYSVSFNRLLLNFEILAN